MSSSSAVRPTKSTTVLVPSRFSAPLLLCSSAEPSPAGRCHHLTIAAAAASAECEAADYAELGIDTGDTALIRTALEGNGGGSGPDGEETAGSEEAVEDDGEYTFEPDPAVLELLTAAKVQGAEHYFSLLSASEVDYEALELMEAPDLVEVRLLLPSVLLLLRKTGAVLK